jgi:CBS domain-containing protein
VTLRVSDYMSSRVVVAEPRDTLARIRNLMLHNDISRVVVVEGSKPIGIVTETDISRVLLSESVRDSPRPIDSILASEVMTSPVVSVGPRVYLKNAASLMIKGGFSGLPVVDGDGNLVGIITKTDIVRAYAEHYHGLCKVREVMSSPVVTVNSLHSIYRVGKLIEKHNIGRVVVLDGGRPVGIITKTDLTFRIAGYSPRKIKFEDEFRRTIKTLRVPVASDIMTPNPLTIGDSEDVAKAAEIMISHKISGLPVVNDSGSLVGIITKTDIVRVVALRDLGV